jgi:hypothetical protein
MAKNRQPEKVPVKAPPKTGDVDRFTWQPGDIQIVDDGNDAPGNDETPDDDDDAE